MGSRGLRERLRERWKSKRQRGRRERSFESSRRRRSEKLASELKSRNVIKSPGELGPAEVHPIPILGTPLGW